MMTLIWGLIVIGVAIGLFWPLSFTSIGWVKVVLITAPLLWVPLGVVALHPLVPIPLQQIRLFFPAALLFSFAYFISPGQGAGLCMLAWLLLAAWLAYRACLELFRAGRYTLAELCATAAYLFLLVGAIWALADRLGIQLLSFDEVVVLLTAVHFHFAGFLLLLATGLAVRQGGPVLFRAAAWLVLTGVPLVSVGILFTHYQAPGWFELAAASLLGLGGLGVAGHHLYLAVKGIAKGRARLFWPLGGILLILGMCLAILYGWRMAYPKSWLSIPWMYAVHGSLNAAAMVLLLLGWLSHRIAAAPSS